VIVALKPDQTPFGVCLLQHEHTGKTTQPYQGSVFANVPIGKIERSDLQSLSSAKAN
jgi:hypothetical protein